MYQGILEPISNCADWFGAIELVDDDTNIAVTDLSGVSAYLAIRKTGENCYPVLTASTATGTITTDDGVIEWHFTPAQLSNLCAGSYEMGLTVSRVGTTDQLFVVTLPIIDGVARNV